LRVLDPELLREPQSHASSLHSSEDLTAREQEVFTMMGRGLSNKEIAAQLAISTHTVKFHISSILGKLGAASRTEAVSLGIKSGKLPI
jgi:DNA-binding NarL/FixJ family response regulator